MKKIVLLILCLISLNAMSQKGKTDKLVVYQLFPRYFANSLVKNKLNGTVKENGCSKFDDIDNAALKSLVKLGVSHVWYTGVIEHASSVAAKPDHPLLVKGRAGSPYAIKDYYDVNSYLAYEPKNRMYEFESLIERTHKNKLKAIIDFVPNHVARDYKSDVKDKTIDDLGAKDSKNEAFSASNNFYYLPGKSLSLDPSIKPLNPVRNPYNETPAKATGNDVFNENPKITDWYETVKLNYGVDYQNGHVKNFSPTPDTWNKMKDILIFWTNKGVDGFRCDMAEMVPVEFWAWVIPQVKKVKPDVLFIAEIYNPKEYKNYLNTGKFDYLYDKVGLYDAVRRLIEGKGDAMDITKVWQNESGEFSNKMLRFLENHDEQRIASEQFGKNPEAGFAGFALSTLLHTGPIMVYNGQEFGAKAEDAEGFSGKDGRSTIFDFWATPETQNYINAGFSDKELSDDEKRFKTFYANILNFAKKNEAIHSGKFHDLQYLNTRDQNATYLTDKYYSFLRYTDKQKLLIVCNFDKSNDLNTDVYLPKELFESKKSWKFKATVGYDKKTKVVNEQFRIPVKLNPNSYEIIIIK
ncbi:MAG: alpha-amylase family glycosyl hydrolase [Leadbetterella sp.]